MALPDRMQAVVLPDPQDHRLEEVEVPTRHCRLAAITMPEAGQRPPADTGGSSVTVSVLPDRAGR